MWDGTTVQTGQPTPACRREVRSVVRIECPGFFGVCQDIRPTHGPVNLHSMMGKSRAVKGDPRADSRKDHAANRAGRDCADKCKDQAGGKSPRDLNLPGEFHAELEKLPGGRI